MISQTSTVTARQSQWQLLDAFLTKDYLVNPQSILVHGGPATGKTYTLKKFLAESQVRSSVIQCQQCLTLRILLQRALKLIKSETGYYNSSNYNSNTDEVVGVENFGVFYTLLAKIFMATSPSEPYILVLDRIDEMPDVSFDLYSCFARISELSPIRNMTIIFIVSSLEPRALVTLTIPHIYFPAYSKEEAMQILNESVICRINTESPSNADLRLRDKFFSLVVDTIGAYTGTNMRRLKAVCSKIWPVFVQPIIDEQFRPSEFVKLYKKCEYLFSSEAAVSEELVSESSGALAEMARTKSTSLASITPNLPRESNYVLCAAYLTSYNPPRYDGRFFSRAKEARARRRDTGRRKQLKINPRSLAAPAFDLERMLAILQSIMSQDDDYETYVPSVDIGVQIATLTKLRLIVRSSSSDPIDSRTRWKVNASWDMVYQAAQEIDFPIEDYLME